MRNNKKQGKRTVYFPDRPAIWSASSVVSDVEDAGRFKGKFDLVLHDDTWGELSWEKAEAKMFEHAVLLALDKLQMTPEALSCMLGGDILNQIISANYAARQLNVPFLGLYGACSTIAEALLIGSVLIDGGYAENAACVAASHFSTAERQYRYPLEMGTTNPPTAQRTVTGAGAVILGAGMPQKSSVEGVCVTGGTFGKVVDLGIKDMTNMGAAMAPAACDTIAAHLKDTGRTIDEFDLVVTGDLGVFGSEMLLELLMAEGLDLSSKHRDCGAMIFDEKQKYDSGGSGAGCSAVVLAAELISLIERQECRRVLFLATGALMSPASSMQGESIPGIAHAVVIEKG